jgi:hypothetical protein
MKPLRVVSAMVTLGICVLTSLAANAADIKDIARAKMPQAQKAVVTIRMVVKEEIMDIGEAGESTIETIGTVIDPDGLTVTDLSSIDPSFLAQLINVFDEPEMRIESKIKEVAIILEDGMVIAADVVLKDSDLGLAFIRPREASHKFDAVVLTNPGAQPQLLDSIFVIGRLSKFNNRASTLALDSIKAISKGPRSFYVGEKETLSFLGCIAYTSNGEPLGIYVMKPRQLTDGKEIGSAQDIGDLMAPDLMLDLIKNTFLPIIRPINDVIESAQRAKKAKLSEKQGKIQK